MMRSHGSKTYGGKSGVYVYLVRPANNDEDAIVNAYAGKAENLGWRIIEHSTHILGLMNEIYDPSGEVVFGKTDDDSHFTERIRLFSSMEQLAPMQEQARDHLARTEFWVMRLEKKRDLDPMEGTLAAYIRRRERATSDKKPKVKSLIKRAPKAGEDPIPTVPNGADLLEFVLHG